MADYVITGHGPTYEVDYGGSGPSLVLIHGLGGSTTNWNAVGSALGAWGKVRAIDLPGFGLTPPRSDFRLSTHRDSIISYLETLDTPTHTLIGNSTGGLLSEMVAAERPDLVDRLVLVSPATPPRLSDPRLDWPTVLRLAVQATPGIGEIYGRHFVHSNTPEELVRKSLEMITYKPGHVPMELIADFREMASIRKQLPWAGHATARTASSVAWLYARRSVFLAMIRAIEARTLVIQGGSDHIVSPGAVEWMCSLHPEWDRLQLEATGHTPQVDAPLRFVRAVGGWLASTAMDATLV